MTYISKKISGIPYSQHKRRGNIDGLKVWTDTVIKQTRTLPKITGGCIAKITFLLPAEKYPSDYPYGSDLDNLINRFFDALNETILSKVPGKDSCIVSLNVTKVRVESDKDAGALLEITSI
jgi:Holliday junction resolvase RusA-like endonuclease